MTKGFVLSVVAAAVVVVAACAVNQSEGPPLAGPSGPAQSVTVTATPDTLKLGTTATMPGDASAIVVQVRGPDGSVQPNKGVRLDIAVGNVLQDCGVLSQHNLTTGSDGRAMTTFTAPGQPLPMPECANFSAGGTVSIFANVIDSNFQTAAFYSASIRMLAPTVITIPGAPIANFNVFPNPAKVGVSVTFVNAGSTAVTGRTIVSYDWDFNDGTTKRGPVQTHDFGAPGTYPVTLTVTDDIGLQGSKTSLVVVDP